MTNEQVLKVVERIGLVKDLDPDNSRLLNDAHEALIHLLTDLATARIQYKKLVDIIEGDK